MKTPEEYFNDQIELPESGKPKKQFSPSEHEFLQKYLGVDQEELLRRLDLLPREAAAEEEASQEDVPGRSALSDPPVARTSRADQQPIPSSPDQPEKSSEPRAGAPESDPAEPQPDISPVPVEEQEESEDFLNAEELQLVSFYLGDQEFAVPITRVQEVIRRVEPAKLPTAPSFMAGIINLRGRVTPLIYLGKLIGKEDFDQDDYKFVIICRYTDFQVGLLVSRVATMYRMTGDSIEWNIDSHLGGGSELLTGLIKHDEKLIGIVDVKMLVDRVLKRTGGAHG